MAMRPAEAGEPRRIPARIAVTLGVFALFLFTMYLAHYRWNPGRMWDMRHLLWLGLKGALILSSGGLVVGLVLGLLGGLGRLSRNVIANQLAWLYVEFVRGTPFLVQIMIFYYCFANVAGLDNKIIAGCFVLGAFSGAYIAEVVRAGIEAVDRGQIEAARSLGLSHGQTMRHVILPQAIRKIIPPLTGQLVTLIKDSSLLYIIGAYELFKATNEIRGMTYMVWEPLLTLAALYLVLTFPLMRVTTWLETRLNPTRRGIHV
jgi:polar amino acid transport system permease protein